MGYYNRDSDLQDCMYPVHICDVGLCTCILLGDPNPLRESGNIRKLQRIINYLIVIV